MSLFYGSTFANIKDCQTMLWCCPGRVSFPVSAKWKNTSIVCIVIAKKHILVYFLVLVHGVELTETQLQPKFKAQLVIPKGYNYPS